MNTKLLVGEREKDPAVPSELPFYVPLSSMCMYGANSNIVPVDDWSVSVLLQYEYTLKEKQNAIHTISAATGHGQLLAKGFRA